MSQLTDFRTRFPEFVSETDERVQLFLDDSALFLNETVWGSKYNLGAMYLTAHFLSSAKSSSTSGGKGGGTGIVSGKSVDGTSVSYSTPTIGNLSESFYASTSYGLYFLSLIKALGITAYVV